MTKTDGRTYPRYDRAGAGTGYSRGCVMLHHAVTSAQHTARLRGAVVVAPNFLFQFITRGAARRVSCLVPRTVRGLSGWCYQCSLHSTLSPPSWITRALTFSRKYSICFPNSAIFVFPQILD